MNSISIKLEFILRSIETSYGFDFENIANFILMLLHPNFHPTRSVHDGKVDGIHCVSEDKRTLYSMYGPKKVDWKKKGKSKVDEEAEGVKDFLLRHEKELKKWFFVVNHELAVDEIEYIKMKFENPDKVDVITPSKFIKLIVEKDKVIETARFLGLLLYDIPMTDLQPHALAKLILTLLTIMKDESKEEKLVKLDRIIEAIIDLSCFNDYKKKPKSSQYVIYHKLWYMIRINTKIKKKWRESFVYIDGSFVQMYQTEDTVFTKNDKDQITFTPENLLFIYYLVKKIREDLLAKDEYSIENLLNDFYFKSQQTFEKKASNSGKS